MATNAALVEKREAFAAKQKAIGEVLETAGSDLDFSKKPILEKLGAADAADATQKFKQWNTEAGIMGEEIARLELKEHVAQFQQREEERSKPAERTVHPSSGDGKSGNWARQFVESKEFKASKASQQDIPLVMDIELKTLFETAAGFGIENRRSGLLVEKATRPIQVIDLIPSAPINQAAYVYMEETTRTHASAERAEGTAYPESTFVWTQKSSPVQKIADSIPVTDEQLEDADQVETLLRQRLSFGVRQRLDQQVLIGNGTAPNLRGILNVSGIQTQALGADDRIAAFMKTLTLIRFTGRANPSGSVFHPTDWQSVILTKTAGGEYLFGNPFMGPGPQSLFGVSVALSDALTQGTAVVGDFTNFALLSDRRGVQVQTGYVGTQFTDGKVTLRADLRAAFTITRPAAFATITGL